MDGFGFHLEVLGRVYRIFSKVLKGTGYCFKFYLEFLGRVCRVLSRSLGFRVGCVGSWKIVGYYECF